MVSSGEEARNLGVILAVLWFAQIVKENLVAWILDIIFLEFQLIKSGCTVKPCTSAERSEINGDFVLIWP